MEKSNFSTQRTSNGLQSPISHETAQSRQLATSQMTCKLFHSIKMLIDCIYYIYVKSKHIQHKYFINCVKIH